MASSQNVFGKVVTALGAVFAMCVITPVDADVGNVRSLFRDCISPMGSADAALCLGYISGLADAIGGARVFFPGSSVSYGEMVAVFIGWASRHPEMADKPRSAGVLWALVERWPCRR